MKALIADDHLLIRVGLTHVLARIEPDVVVLEATAADEALSRIESNDDLGLVIIEPRLPGLSLQRISAALRSKKHRPNLVLFSSPDTRSEVLRMIDFGASAFLFKTATEDEILEALRAVQAGGVHLPRGLRDTVATPRPAPTPAHVREDDAETISPQSLARLTKRQQEVLEQLTLGRSNADIAGELGTSEHTIRIHVSAILKSLNVSNRTKAALAAAPYFRRQRLKQSLA